jgi:hypothetical protein
MISDNVSVEYILSKRNPLKDKYSELIRNEDESLASERRPTPSEELEI